MAYARDIMRKNVITANENDKIQDVSRLLTEKKISNIPIVNSNGELAGIVSEQDIIRAMQSQDFMNMTANDIMTKEVLSIKEDDCLEYISKMFIEHPFRRLPVTRDKKVVGIITRKDIISNFMSDYY